MRKVELKKKASQALIAILFFMVFYLVLVALAAGFAILCGYGGIALIALKPTFITIMLGLGLVGLGCLVLFFVLKFLFQKHKTDLSGMTQIFEKDEPKLFALIRELSTEIKTDFPKKIFLTPDVNASVFYDSGFWSMFLPIRKNLQIGLGLVNSVTESEFKAILAHEFGHFSQKSMKIGSYVYNVNKIIYNLLYDNESYNSAIVQWANISDYFAIFVKIGIKIIEAIQWMLRQAYKIVNLSYMELSREMEFHADEVAASVAGSKPLIDSLMRLELADTAYNNVINYYNGKISENKKTDNIYPQHAEVLRSLTTINKLPVQNDLPLITKEFVSRFQTSQLVIKDQWASHPTTSERVDRLESLGYKAEISGQSAWNYFTQKEKWQEEITSQLFKHVKYSGLVSNIDLQNFKADYNEQLEQYSIDPRYKGFYDNRDIQVFNLEEEIQKSTESGLQWEEIFNEELENELRKESGLNGDMFHLEQIRSGGMEVNTFEYSGKKYKPKQASALLENLKKEKELLENNLKEIDVKTFRLLFSRANAKGSGNVLKEKYQDYFKCKQEFSKDTEQYNDLMDDLQFIQETLPFHEIRRNFNRIKLKEEPLKRRFLELLTDTELASQLDEESRKELDGYLSKDLLYFYEPTYYEENLRILFFAINTLYNLSFQRFFKLKKKLLTEQLEYLK